MFFYETSKLSSEVLGK